MSYFDTYKNRVQYNGSSYAERQRNNVMKDMVRKFKKSPSYYEVDMIDLQGNILQRGVQIFDDNSLSKLDKTNVKRIIMQPNEELKTGFRFKYGDKEWLCIKKDELLTDKGIIQEMDDIISWYNPYNKLITCFASTSNATMYSLGINEQKLTTVDGMLKITLPDNLDTQQINRGQRFIYKNRFAYEVTFIDISMNGLINLTLKEVEVSPNDNLVLGIADYYNRSVYTVLIKEDNLSIAPNTTTQLHATVTKDGIVVNEEIEWISSNENVATVDSNGNVRALTIGNCVISARLKGNNDNFNSIGCSVANAPVSNSYITIQGDNSISWGMSKLFKGVKLVNGVEQPTNFTFTIDYMGNPETLCNLEIINGSTCKIVGNTDQLEGSIKLVAVNVLNAQECYTKSISIMGFW